mmetsp:Transcript_10796/g.15928  ORF Transcript_10796/g.15928 Transcript_10796/m.15928 type:complete len:123 (+) Transcript_10796:103-471(+)
MVQYCSALKSVMKMLKDWKKRLRFIVLQPLPYHHTQTTQSNQYNDNNNVITHHNEKVTIQSFEIMKHWNECYYDDDDEAVYEQIEDDILNQQSYLHQQNFSSYTETNTTKIFQKEYRRFIKG